MVDTFTPPFPPQEAPSGEIVLRIKQTQFGDGYRQIVGDGLNTKIQRWPLTWKGTVTEIREITDFMDAHIGVSFYYTPPNGVQGRYACMNYQEVPEAAGNMSVNAVLEQVFFP
jgi:phage-related protein